MAFRVTGDFIADHNRQGRAAVQEDFDHLGRALRRRGVDIERLVARAQALQVAVNSWGLGTGGTRFARFAGRGEPRDLYEKVEDAELEKTPGFDPAYMLDQSHNVTDPAESLMASAGELVRAYVQAHLVDRPELAEHQQRNDALMALETLKRAFRTDVSPILAVARERSGGALDPLGAFRACGYRRQKDAERPARMRTGGGGIV